MSGARNKEALFQLANALESGQVAKEMGIGFNMRWINNSPGGLPFPMPDMSGHSCGTVACVAGTTCAMFNLGLSIHDAGSFLGLTISEQRALFQPRGWSHDDDGGGYTAKQAAAVVRHFGCEDVIDWSLFDKEGKRTDKC